MKKLYQVSLVVFRRDLRLSDNTALNKALEQSEYVIPCFIFDPRQVTEKNDYFSANAVQFMIESLQSLDKELHKHKGRLYIFKGEPDDIIAQLKKKIDFDALFINKDYTPFSVARDKKIERICSEHDIVYNSFDDVLLNSPDTVRKKDGTYYSVFTAFYNNASLFPVEKPYTVKKMSFYSQPIAHSLKSDYYKAVLSEKNADLFVNGGRENSRDLLSDLTTLQTYDRDHNFPALQTSGLSASLKFGTVSVREVYYAIVEKLGRRHPLIRQLYWRDFFTHIGYHCPNVFGHPFREKYKNIAWNTSKKDFNRWCNGTTGFPIVDAGMRQLNTTGFMHNRVRMIVASFLIKDLHINWLWGEKYFAQQLVDYDPAVNNGNWQWIASTGCDAQPYFRIFNPWLQQKKFDPECEYIKTWVPELKNVDVNIIHNWFKEKSPFIKDYPRPMVDHAKESMLTKKMYAKR